MKQLITIIIFSLLFCACGTSPQNNSMALVLSDTEIIKINPGSPHLIRADMAKTIDRLHKTGFVRTDGAN